MNEDIFKEVQAIEVEADRVIHEAHRTCADIRAELPGKLESLSKKREGDLAAHKPKAEEAANGKLKTELEKLDELVAAERTRLEKLATEQTAALADLVVERFGKEGS